MSSSRSISGALSLLVGLASIGGVVWWMTRPPEPPVPPAAFPEFPIPVTTTPVVVGDVAESIELVGDVQAPERAALAFERGGRIVALLVELGDVVQRGAIVARLDDRVMLEQVRASAAALDQSRAMADVAARDAERLKKIADIGSTRAELDRAESVARNALARVAQMEADLAVESAKLEQGVLTAPFTALVVRRPVALGSYVAAGDSCCELVSIERTEILIEMPPAIAAQVTTGMAVDLTSDALPGFARSATIAAVLPSPTTMGRTFTGVVRIEPEDKAELGTGKSPGRLSPGMFVRARLRLRSVAGALLVPIDALFGEGDELRIAIVSGDPPKAAHVAVELLARDAERAAIRPRGDVMLAVGTAVIVAGKENVTPGKAVIAVAAASGSGQASPR